MDDLKSKGITPYVGLSGNGRHLLVRTIDYPVGKEKCDSKKDPFALLLRYLERKYSDARAEVDCSTYNAGRVWKIYGTLSMKGGNTVERPRRLARFKCPEVTPVPMDILSLYKAEIEEQIQVEAVDTKSGRGHFNASSSSAKTADIVGLFNAKGIYVRHIAAGKHSVICPWASHHSTGVDGDSSTVIFDQDSGQGPGFKCLHNSCTAKNLRDILTEFGYELASQFGFHTRSSQTSNSSDWLAPRPLEHQGPSAPTLPIDMLPVPFQPWIEDIADRMQVPPEMVAAPALVALSTVIGRCVGICPKRFDNWIVIANLWGSTVARPGYFKTPTIAEALKPLGKLIAKARAEFQKEKAVKESEMLALEALEAALKDQLKKAAKDNLNTDAIVKELADVKQKKAKCVAIEKRYKTNDSTIPKLVMLLETRPEGILMVRDELSGFMRNLDRPGCEGDREFFLEAWNGLGSYNVDRVGRESNYVEGLCISLLGGIQPGKLRAYVLESVRGGVGDDGFLQRLQLAIYPDNLGSWKNVDRKPNREAANRVFEIFQKLDAFDFGAFCSERHLEYEIPVLRFDQASQDVFDRWREELENKLRSKAVDCPAFESHLAKYRSLFPSLALIFHLVDLADGGTDQNQVSVEAAINAANWCDFLEAHARKVYAAAIDTTSFAVEALAKKIKKGEVTDGMNVRDIYRHHWSLLDKPEYLEPALIALDKEYGWLRVVTVRPATGRPSEIVRLNPAIIKEVES